MIDDRFKFAGVQNFIPMSDASIAARDAFIQKYEHEDILEEQSCYICGENNLTIISEIDRYGFYYPTAICSDCGNVQQKAYYRDDVLQDFYSNYYRKIYGNQTPSELFSDQRAQGKLIYDFVASVCQPQSVLEVGCGAGGILGVFSEKGCEVLGLDFDDEYLHMARQNNVPVINGSLDRIDADQKFDCIVLSHVLEHIVNPVAFLKRLRGHLSDGGTIYIEVPSLHFVCQGGYHYDLLTYWQNAHTIHFTRETLRLLCKRAGLHSVKETDFINSCWQKSSDSQNPGMDEKRAAYTASVDLLGEIASRWKRANTGIPKLKSLLRRGIITMLDLLGLKPFVKSIYHRVRR